MIQFGQIGRSQSVISSSAGQRAASTAPSTPPTNPFFMSDQIQVDGRQDNGLSLYSKNAQIAQTKDIPSSRNIRYKGMSNEEIIAKYYELRDAREYEDYSGMSDEVIYQKIYDKYADAFGEDFSYDINRLNTNNVTSCISSGYGRELLNQFGSYDRIYAINRNRLYGDMSIPEIQDSIRSKYPEQLTNGDFCSMMIEMSEVEAAPGDTFWYLFAYQQMVIADGGPAEMWTAQSSAKWNDMLDKPMNKDFMLTLYNGHKRSNNGADEGMLLIEGLLRKLFGVELNSDGYFDPYEQEKQRTHVYKTQ